MTLAEIVAEDRPPATVVAVRGEVDLSNVDVVRAAIVDAVPHDGHGVVLDLSATRYLDSSGIRLLFELAERLQGRRQRLAVVVTEAALVRRVLVLTKLDEAIPILADVDDAIAVLASP